MNDALSYSEKKLKFLYDKKLLYLTRMAFYNEEFYKSADTMSEEKLTTYFSFRNVNFTSLMNVNKTITILHFKLNVDKKLFEEEVIKADKMMNKIIAQDKIIIEQIKKLKKELSQGLSKIQKFENYIRV